MANVRLGYIFPGDASATTITASSAASGFPASNIKDVNPGKVWRGADAALSGVTLDFDFGAAKTIQAIGITRHNLTAAATVNIKADDEATFTSPPINQNIHANLAVLTRSDGTTTVIPRLFYFWAASWSYRYMRVTLTDAANPDNRLEIGRIMPYGFIEPSVNISDQIRKEFVDPSIITGSGGMFPRKKTRKKYWTYGFEFGSPFVTRAQQDQWLALIDYVGLGNPVCFSIQPDEKPTEDSVYGVFDKLGAFEHVFLDQSVISGVVVKERP